MSKTIGLFAIASTLAVSAFTQSNALTLDFKGTALPGSQGYVAPDLPSNIPTVSFAGNPVDISLTLTDSPDGLYVQNLTETWSTASYAFPYVLSSGATGFPYNIMYDGELGIESMVAIGASGGTIAIYSTPGYDTQTDGDLSLTLSYTLSSPQASGSSFMDNAVSGGGSLDAYVNGYYDPSVGPYDADSSLTFSLSSITEIADAPEPGTWAMVLAGFVAIGGAFRARRREPKSKQSF